MTKTLSLKTIIGFAVPYGFVCASLYLYAYWHPMGLNPFHYANAADLVSATLGGIVVSFALIFIGMGMGFVTSPAMSRKPDAEQARPGRLETFNAYAGLILIPIIFLGTWWRGWPVKWFVTGVAIAMILPLLLRGNNWYTTTFETPRERFVASLIAIILPFAFFGQGAIGIDKALTPGTGMLVDVSRSGLDFPTSGQLMYVGMLGDFHVIRELSTESTLLVPGANRVVLKETKFEKSRPLPAQAKPVIPPVEPLPATNERP